MRRSRSAEQTARALLSSAVRYDTWECAASKEKATGVLVTFQITWGPLPLDRPFADVVALHMTLYDVSALHFVGSTYVVSRADIQEPILFHSSPDDMILVVEMVVAAPLPDDALRRQSLCWGYVRVSDLVSSNTLTLYPGSAQVLLLGRGSWPTFEGKEEECRISFDAVAVEDVSMCELLRRLVPPGVMVPRSFASDTPQASTNTFRCVVQDICVAISSEEAGWRDTRAEWSVAAVAHNGYKQLGQGFEVSLVFEDDGNQSEDSTYTSESLVRRPRSGAAQLALQHSLSSLCSSDGSEYRERLLHSIAPLEIDGLPVHSSTSLVFAIRRKGVKDTFPSVVGYCVLPLCIMPLKDRDVRVRDLPTLQGPFSCSDPRMVMLEPSSPYGKLPIVMTLVVGYFDTGVVDTLPQLPPVGKDGPGRAGRERRKKDGVNHSAKDVAKERCSLLSVAEGATLIPVPFSMAQQTMEILSTADAQRPPATGDEKYDKSSLPVLHFAEDDNKAMLRLKESGTDVFKMLCSIMEELRHLREIQEEITRHKREWAADARRHSDSAKQLEDAAESVAILNLTPISASISWETRIKLRENLVPILHPQHGIPIDDGVPASCTTAGSQYGIRFEGLTADDSIAVPENICFMFSFGPLPFQTLGPIRTAAVGKSQHISTFKLYERNGEGGLIWCEPLEAARDLFVHKFKHQYPEAQLYVHMYNALTMFYVCSANIRLSDFRRPYNAESARIPADLMIYRDLSLTETQVPSKVLPIVRNAGSLHVTLFCVCSGHSLPREGENCLVEPMNGSRVIVAKRLPHANLMEINHQQQPREGDQQSVVGNLPSAADYQHAAQPGGASIGNSTNVSQPPLLQPTMDVKQAVAGGAVSAPVGVRDDIHWRRANYIKQLYGGGAVSPFGANLKKDSNEAESEFKLRYLEKQRDEMKSRKIGEALMERLTVRCYVSVSISRPETVPLKFQNPFSRGMQFSVEVDAAAGGKLEVVSPPTFHLGPREQLDLLLVVRLHELGPAEEVQMLGNNSSEAESRRLRLLAYVYTFTREAVRIIEVNATVGPALVDRRYEIFGASGSKVVKKIFSRTFSSTRFPVSLDRENLLMTMRDACVCVGIASDQTKAESHIVLDPITQSFVTAWEEITISTTIPQHCNEQRVEYLTLFEDAKRCKVLEVWELNIFASQTVMTRELMFGQTTAVVLPSEGVEAIYSSDPLTRIERRGDSYLLHLRPQEVGTKHLLLHSLTKNHLAKTLVTAPTVYPAPTYTQTIELSMGDLNAPILRRLQFVNVGTAEDMFTIHHNYKYQLRVTPKRFVLAPQETQVITIRIGMLKLPEYQMEGRWPMWIFINNSVDKTVESYLLHVVLYSHRPAAAHADGVMR